MRIGVRLAALAMLVSLMACEPFCSPPAEQRHIAGTGEHVTASVTGHLFTDGKTVKNGVTVDQTNSLFWTITFSADVTINGDLVIIKGANAIGTGNSDWAITRLDGQVTWSATNPSLSCSGTLSKRPGALTQDLTPFLDVLPPQKDGEKFTVTAGVPGNAIVVSSDQNPSDSQCNSEQIVGPTQADPQYQDWAAILNPKAEFAASGTKPFSFSYNGPVSAPPELGKATVNVNGQVTLAFTLTKSS